MSFLNPLFLFGPTGVGKTHLVRGLLKCFRERRRRPEAGGGFHKVAYGATAIRGKRFRQSFIMPMQTMPAAMSNAVISSLLGAPILIRQKGCVSGSAWSRHPGRRGS